MNPFKNYYKRIVKQDFINKFKTNRNKKLPKLKKITLNFGCKSFPLPKFATTMLALEIITKKKPSITKSKKPNILLKIQKGQPVGGKVELKKNSAYTFINNLNLTILAQFKNFSGVKMKNHTLFCQLPKNTIKLQELEAQYPLFSELPILDINISTNVKNTNELMFFAKSMKLSKNKNNKY
uniref:ribosomal protein L5 n=1 Tax=Navicula tsukamotoi TaxID=2018706 RepID=UPI0020282669|nr:ribosomal protein L5 [Navicula tsukamotoi]QYB23096.1 ribosomal protein L5 [Navicula tsukamotoi]